MCLDLQLSDYKLCDTSLGAVSAVGAKFIANWLAKLLLAARLIVAPTVDNGTLVAQHLDEQALYLPPTTQRSVGDARKSALPPLPGFPRWGGAGLYL